MGVMSKTARAYEHNRQRRRKHKVKAEQIVMLGFFAVFVMLAALYFGHII